VLAAVALVTLAVGASPAAPSAHAPWGTPDTAAVRILALGDFGVGGEQELRTGAAIRAFAEANATDLLLTLGDNDYTRGESFTVNWTDAFGWTAETGLAVAGVLGNHDYEHGDAGVHEFDELGMPARRYVRRVGPVDLIVLDSNAVDAIQTAWLARKLAGSRAPWQVVAFHHPPFVCGAHAPSEEVLARWVPLFARYGADLVLTGHEHSYQRFAPVDGVTYVVHGGGGAGLYPVKRCRDGYPRRARARKGYGFLELAASRERLDVAAWDRAGHRVDRVSLERQPVAAGPAG
jgi:hypothetical protein